MASFLIDIVKWLTNTVVITDPETIRALEASGAVDRLHAIPTRELPIWWQLFFSGSRFLDAKRDEWFVPFDPASTEVQERRAYIVSKLYDARGAPRYTVEDVEHVVSLLKAGATDKMLGEAMVNILGPLFVDTPTVPVDVTEAAYTVLQSPKELLSPCRYIQGRKAAKYVVDYSAARIPTGVCPIDVSHNINAIAFPFVTALRSLQRNATKPVLEVFNAAPPTPNLLRIAIKSGTFAGQSLRARKTVVLYDLSKAAPVAQDPQLRFTFGTGSDERLCAFREYFVAFMGDVRSKLVAQA